MDVGKHSFKQTIPIKLKINDHYETLCLRKLYQQWSEDQLKLYNFSKAQLSRIKQQFEQFHLHDEKNKTLKIEQQIQPSTEQNLSIQSVDVNFNLDVYTESDFDQYTPKFSNKFYYQQLLNKLNS